MSRFGSFLALCLTLFFVSLGSFAVSLRLDYCDSFEILRNAQSLAGQPPGGWIWGRPFLVSQLMFAPLTPLGPDRALTLAHGVAALITTLCVAATYRLGRRVATPFAAALGSVLFAINPLVLHNAALAKEDVPSTLFLTLAILFFIDDVENERPNGWRGALMGGLAMATKFNLIPVVYFLVTFFLLVTSRKTTALRRILHALGLYAAPAVLFLAFPILAFPLADLAGPLEAPGIFFENFLKVFSRNQGGGPSSLVYVLAAREVVTVPALVLAFGGAIYGLLRADRRVLFLAGALVSFLVLHMFFVGAKEARYLLPIFPAAYVSLSYGWDALLRNRGRGVRCAAALILIALPIYHAAVEIWRLADPVYHGNFQRDVALAAKERSSEGRIAWIGTLYAVIPERAFVLPGDPYTSVYHMYGHHVEYFTGLRVGERLLERAVASDPVGKPFYPIALGEPLRDGEAVIINPEPRFHHSWSRPEQAISLFVARVRARTGAVAHGDSTARTFRIDDGEVVMEKLPVGRDVVTGRGVSPGVYQLQFVVGQVSALSEPIAVLSDTFRYEGSVTRPGLLPDRVDLIEYEAVQEFSPYGISR